jgi:diguanylate cyclase (GGDEF)-like protein
MDPLIEESGQSSSSDNAIARAAAAQRRQRPVLSLSKGSGMAMRMAIGLAALAVTVIIANVLTQQSTRATRSHMRQLVAEHEPLVRAGEALAAAIATYQRTTLEASENTATREEVEDAARQMSQAVASYAGIARNADQKQLDDLAADLQRYQTLGDALVKHSAARRSRSRDYAVRFDALGQRLNAPQTQAARFAGAVFASEALIDLTRQYNLVRDKTSAALGTRVAGATQALAASENDFRSTLEAHRANLAKAQGEEWIETVRSEFEQVVATRRAVFSSIGELIKSSSEFRDHGARVSRVVLTRLLDPARSALSDANQLADRAAQSADRQALWTSVAVLLLMLVISVATVTSVTSPVRRLIEATHSLAGGKVRTRVPRGGVRELDALAEAFNEMAGQLEKAETEVRSYHAQLEAKVDERTRELQHLADHDPLTQLPNRRQLFARLRSALEQANFANTRVALLFIDLDNFKTINDCMGHAFGDRVLQVVSERLRENIRFEHSFSARLGGDEFTVVCENVSNLADVERFSLAVLEEFQRPLTINGRELRLSVSVGAGVYPDHASDAQALLRAADAALFRAKELGRNRSSLFAPELLQAASSRFRIEQALRLAVERGEFELLYQPEVCFETLETHLSEALLRWHQGDGVVVGPGDFLQIAEQSGLIVEISDWVLRTSIQTAATWHKGAWPEARVAVNVSAQQLLGGGFVERLEDLLSQYGLPPRCVEIELTENVLQTGPATINALHMLRELGVSLALDDFGTGYSSLTSLERLPLNRVKIDRSLIGSIDSGSRSFAIVRSIIGLCHSLGLQVTVEGVERVEQLGLLLADRGVQVQGYLISRPVPAARIPAFVAATREQLQSLLLAAPMPEQDLESSGMRALRILRAGVRARAKEERG